METFYSTGYVFSYNVFGVCFLYFNLRTTFLQGCFAQKRKKRGVTPSPSTLSGKLWYQSYKKCLTSSEVLLEVSVVLSTPIDIRNRTFCQSIFFIILVNLQTLENKVFEEIFGGLMEYIKNYSVVLSTLRDEIPTATLLTGKSSSSTCH